MVSFPSMHPSTSIELGPSGGSHHPVRLFVRMSDRFSLVDSTDDLRGWKPEHLLDALFFLKVYASAEVNACWLYI